MKNLNPTETFVELYDHVRHSVWAKSPPHTGNFLASHECNWNFKISTSHIPTSDNINQNMLKFFWPHAKKKKRQNNKYVSSHGCKKYKNGLENGMHHMLELERDLEFHPSHIHW